MYALVVYLSILYNSNPFALFSVTETGEFVHSHGAHGEQVFAHSHGEVSIKSDDENGFDSVDFTIGAVFDGSVVILKNGLYFNMITFVG